MKLLLFCVLSVLFLLAPLRADPLNPQGNAKITKNEAEHIALKQYPGERVDGAKLETVQGKLVWSLQLSEAKGKAGHIVAVDAMTGRIAQDEGKKP